MRFIFLFFILNYFVFSDSFAQGNLVPNPSFEIHDSCPDNLSQFRFVSNWKALMVTPDYYNKCSSNNLSSVPDNFMGFQETQAVQDSAYAGLYMSLQNNTSREFIGVKLNSQMQIGIRYFISFMISSGSNLIANSCYCNRMGVKLTTDFLSLSDNSVELINNQATIFEDSIMTDTVNWNVFRASFIADSVYDGIVIGNFFDLDSLNTSCVANFGPNAYYYIDNVCLSTDSNLCFNLTNVDTVFELNYPVIQYYSGSHQVKVVVEGHFFSQTLPLTMYNSIGQIIFEKYLLDPESTFELPNVSSGIYFLHCLNTTIKIFIEP